MRAGADIDVTRLAAELVRNPALAEAITGLEAILLERPGADQAAAIADVCVDQIDLDTLREQIEALDAAIKIRLPIRPGRRAITPQNRRFTE